MTKTDILVRADIELLLDKFYDRLLSDPVINYIFTDVARLDLASHLPSLADFWEQVLFGGGQYTKNVLKIHLDLDEKTPLTREHFDVWLQHFNETADLYFEGKNTEAIKTRAQSIATVMRIKLSQK